MGAAGTIMNIEDKNITFKDGKAFVFDDFSAHEVWHDGSTRVHLIADIWHPDLTQKEIEFMSILGSAKVRHAIEIA